MRAAVAPPAPGTITLPLGRSQPRSPESENLLAVWGVCAVHVRMVSHEPSILGGTCRQEQRLALTLN